MSNFQSPSNLLKLSPPLQVPEGLRLNAAAPGAGVAVIPWEARANPDVVPATTALVHDFLAQAGGAERVVAALHALFPSAPLYTSVYDPSGNVAWVCW